MSPYFSTKKILLINAGNNGKQSSNGKIEHDNQTPPNLWPSLGLLTLGTSLNIKIQKENLPLEIGYFDGTIFKDAELMDYITINAQEIFMLAFGALTCNYGASLIIADHAKRCNPKIITVFGNDHFSVLYKQVMRNRPNLIDWGFKGNDVVEGFTEFVADYFKHERIEDKKKYPGLVYRDLQDPNKILFNAEDPSEYPRLPLIDYSIADSLFHHSTRYTEVQHKAHSYLVDNNRRVNAIDFARGCIKFAGKRNESDIPLNACEFCAILPGSKEIVSQSASKAWEIIHNAFNQGYNYLFVAADELPNTFWPLLKNMAANRPKWYEDLPREQRPIMYGYARADAFRDNRQERIETLIDRLNFDQFFVGIEAFSDVSLRAFNKGMPGDAKSYSLAEDNYLACAEIARQGGTLAAGIVLTHLGITRTIMEENFRAMEVALEKFAPIIRDVTFDILDPIPGSHAFEYLRVPGFARQRANELGLEVDDEYLATMYEKYRNSDVPDNDGILEDFHRGCCPALPMDQIVEYLQRTWKVLERCKLSSAIAPTTIKSATQ
jgi:hypothetical protein